MQKLAENPIVIEKLTHDGRGVGRVDGKTVFVEGALPKETVRFAYRKQRGRYDEGFVTEVITAAKERVEPQCPHFTQCGGCSLQHIDAPAQIAFKQAILLEQFQQIAHLQPEALLAPLQADIWGYRHKARLGVRYVAKKERTLVGFREKNQPRFLADINRCEVLHPSVGQRIEDLKHLIDQLKAREHIAQIEVAVGDDHTALIFRNLSPLPSEDEALLINYAQQTHLHIYLQPKNKESIYRLYPPKEAAPELLHYHLTEFNISLNFHPSDFTQINASLNQKMVKQTIELLELKNNDVVLDLFCGLGNFSLPIATRCKSVVGVEGYAQMVARASANAAANNINNAQFYCANLEELNQEDYLARDYNKLLIDPPRCGALAIIKQLSQNSFERIVYISCNPATLARDADELVNQQGYRLAYAGVMDMFTHTSHIESIAVFTRK